jgi:hypothetical protein
MVESVTLDAINSGKTGESLSDNAGKIALFT